MTAMALGTTSLGATSATLRRADRRCPAPACSTSVEQAETALGIKDINANTAYKALFPGQTLTNPTNSNSQTAGCVNAAAGTTDAMVDSMLPPLTETFARRLVGGSITISATALDSYFYDAGGGQFCMAVYGGGGIAAKPTMGDTFLRGFVTIIDLANMQVGFAPTLALRSAGRRAPRTGPDHAARHAPRARSRSASRSPREISSRRGYSAYSVISFATRSASSLAIRKSGWRGRMLPVRDQPVCASSCGAGAPIGSRCCSTNEISRTCAWELLAGRRSA